MKIENYEKKKLQVTSYELQVEDGNANYANFRGYISVGSAEFAEFAVEKKKEGNADDADFRGCVFLKFAEFAQFAVKKKEGGNANDTDDTDFRGFFATNATNLH